MEFLGEETRNLSDASVSRRLRFGILCLFLALAVAIAFHSWGLPATQRAWLFVPFFLAGNVFFQAIFKTCGFSAMRGVRHTASGRAEVVADRRCREGAMRVGKKQLLFSFVGAVLLTLLFMVV